MSGVSTFLCLVFLTISEDVCVAAQEAAQCVLQLAVILVSLQGSTDGLLRSLDHQHGGLYRSQTGVHQLGLGDVTSCKTTFTTAGGNRDTCINNKLHNSQPVFLMYQCKLHPLC